MLSLILIGLLTLTPTVSRSQTSTNSSTKPSATPDPIVNAHQSVLDKSADVAKQLIAARATIVSLREELQAKDKKDEADEKLIAIYQKSETLCDDLIAAYKQNSADKDQLIKDQAQFIQYLLAHNKKSNPILTVLKVAAGVVLGKLI